MAPRSEGAVLDSGALIAFEKPSRRVVLHGLLAEFGARQIVVSAGSVAEVWRGSGRQAGLARLLNSKRTTVVDMTVHQAMAIGVFVGRSGSPGRDIVDAARNAWVTRISEISRATEGGE